MDGEWKTRGGKEGEQTMTAMWIGEGGVGGSEEEYLLNLGACLGPGEI